MTEEEKKEYTKELCTKEVLKSLKPEYFLFTKHGLVALSGSFVAAILVTLGVSWKIVHSSHAAKITRDIAKLKIEADSMSGDIAKTRTKVQSMEEEAAEILDNMNHSKIDTLIVEKLDVVSNEGTLQVRLDSSEAGSLINMYDQSGEQRFYIRANFEGVAGRLVADAKTDRKVTVVFKKTDVAKSLMWIKSHRVG